MRAKISSREIVEWQARPAGTVSGAYSSQVTSMSQQNLDLTIRWWMKDQSPYPLDSRPAPVG